MANSRGFLRRPPLREPTRASLDYGEVTRVAYELYEQRGRMDGRDLEDWLRAEAIVRQRQAARSN